MISLFFAFFKKKISFVSLFEVFVVSLFFSRGFLVFVFFFCFCVYVWSCGRGE